MESQQEKCLPVTQGTQRQRCCSKWWTFKNASKHASRLDGPYAFFVCLCGFICVLIPIGCAYSYGLLFPVLLVEFKEGKARTAWVGSLAYASGSLFGPFVGLLCDRFSHRKVAVGGGMLASLSLFATSQAPSLTMMYFTFGLTFGLGCSCLYFVSLTILPKYFLKRRALATGLVLMGPCAGLIVMSPIIQSLLNATTWRVTLIAMAGMTLITCFLSFSFDSNVPKDECQVIKTVDESSDVRSSLVVLASARKAESSQLCSTLIFSYLKNKEFVIHLIASITCFCGLTIPIVHMARYCQEQGIDANRSFVMYLFNGVASVLLRALTGHICDIQKLDPRWVLQIAMFLAGIISVLMTHFRSYNELFACFVLYGVMDGTIVSSLNILALYTLSPEERPQGFGFFHLCIAISLAAGPPLGGFLADLSGAYTLTFYIAGTFHVVAGCILFLSYCVKGTKRSRESLTKMLPLENFVIIEKVTVL